MAERDPGAGAQAGPPGVIASLRGLAANATGIVQARLQLLANELEEERARTLQLIVYGAIALFCAGVGILLLSAWIVVAFWDQYRLVTLAALAVAYFAGCVLALRALRARAAVRPKLFSTSLAELKRDKDLLQS